MSDKYQTPVATALKVALAICPLLLSPLAASDVPSSCTDVGAGTSDDSCVDLQSRRRSLEIPKIRTTHDWFNRGRPVLLAGNTSMRPGRGHREA